MIRRHRTVGTSLPYTGITQPADLKGKTTATASGSVSELLFPAYAKPAGLDPKMVKLQGAGLMPAGLTPDQVADFTFVPAA